MKMFYAINCFIILFLIGFCEPLENCVTEYKNATYDFRSLSLRSHNHDIKNEDNQTFSINICSKSNFKQLNAVNCKKYTSICLIEGNVSYEIASISNSLLIENNGLFSLNYQTKLNYKNCQTIKSHIHFLCEQSRPHEFEPEFVKFDNCSFEFQWRTMYACHESHSINLKKYETAPLKFKLNETVMDFNQILKPGVLEKTNYTTSDEVYHFVIQNKDNVNKNYFKCLNSLVCQTNLEKNFSRSLGIAEESILEYGNRGFHLIMEADNLCGRNKDKKARTVFNLFCHNQTSISFEYETHYCDYLFNVYNPIICDYQKKLDILLKNVTVETSQKLDATTENPSVSDSFSTVYSESLKENSSNTTMLGFAILTVVSVIGIVLAAFSLINDDRRTWLQNRLRRIIGPQTATSFHYSQLSTNFLLNNDRNDNFNSPYLPTTLPKNNDQKNYDELENSNLKEKSSIREQLEKLRIINDNDLGVSRNNYPSFKLPKNNLIGDEYSNDKDVEINLLN